MSRIEGDGGSGFQLEVEGGGFRRVFEGGLFNSLHSVLALLLKLLEILLVEELLWKVVFVEDGY